MLVFEYPRRQRLPLLLMLGGFAIFGVLSLVVAGVSAMQIIVGRALLDGTGTDDPGTLLAAIIIPTLMIIGGILVNLMFPAVHVTSDGFRISRLFYTSRWLTWGDIRDVKTHWLSSRWRRVVGVTVEGISPLYDIVGAFQLLGSRGFLISDGIDNCTELMELFRNYRPDLFD